MQNRFIALGAPPAACELAGALRGGASRIWTSHSGPRAALLAAAREIADRCPQLAGRVHAVGHFEEDAVHRSLAAHLPCPPELVLRRRFEWYACRGAFFHNDAHYASVLFGAWCVGGPPREIVFPRAGVRVPASVGDLVIFDPFEPHAVLEPHESVYDRNRYVDTAPSVFVGFELELDAAAREAFCVSAPALGAVLLSSKVPINAETGQVG